MLKILKLNANPKAKKPAGFDKFNKVTRENWGYWDGVNARKLNRYPQWTKSSVHRGKHPFDKAYGEGFWKGWYGDEPPNKFTMGKKNPMKDFRVILRHNIFRIEQFYNGKWRLMGGRYLSKELAQQNINSWRKQKIVRAKKNPAIKKGDLVRINAPGLPGHGKTGRVLGQHTDHFQIQSGPEENKNYMHPASRLTVVRKNPKKRKTKKSRVRIIRAKKNMSLSEHNARHSTHKYIIAGIAADYGKPRTVYFNGRAFSLSNVGLKTFNSPDAAMTEAKRILPLLPKTIERIWTEMQ